MGVHEKFSETDIDQMIKRKSNERLLKNRYQRLGQSRR